MRWKTFRQIVSDKGGFNDETQFVLGMDIGSSMSTLAYWDVTRNAPELIDMSGGYGKPSIPTVLQYVPETNDWVFGEYALLNKGFFDDITFYNLTDRLGKHEFVDIAGKSVSIGSLLSRFIKELIDSCKNINPNSEVVGLVVAIPPYMTEEAKEEYRRAVVSAGYEKEFITFMQDRECILRFNSYTKAPPRSKENILVLDYGSSEVRGGIYEVTRESETDITVESLSSVVSCELGMKNVDESIKNLFVEYYCEEKNISPKDIDKQTYIQLESFAYHNKDSVFQNGMQDRQLKLYFNFCYPAFHKVLTNDVRYELANKYQRQLFDFIRKCHELTTKGSVDPLEIDSVICMGGGFETYWARETVAKFFPENKVSFYKNGGGLVTLGACIGAASHVRVVPECRYNIKDEHILKDNIGIKALANGKEKFYNIVDKNTFWWQEKQSSAFILSEPSDKAVEVSIYKQNEDGDDILISKVALENLPKRPKNTTRLIFKPSFKKSDELTLQIVDDGFGDFFPKSDFKQEVTVKI